MSTDSPKRDRADKVSPATVHAVRTVFDECMVEAENNDSPLPAVHPATHEPCTLGELKAALGQLVVSPPLSAASVHLIVTGATYADLPGPIYEPGARGRASHRTSSGRVERVVEYTETHRVTRDKGDKVDRPVLVARVPAGRQFVTTTRRVTIDANTGEVLDPGQGLHLNKKTDEETRPIRRGDAHVDVVNWSGA